MAPVAGGHAWYNSSTTLTSFSENAADNSSVTFFSGILTPGLLEPSGNTVLPRLPPLEIASAALAGTKECPFPWIGDVLGDATDLPVS